MATVLELPSAQVEQGTEDWHRARLGKVTASRVADVIAKTKSGYSASRKNYAAQLICERLTGRPTEGFTSAAMQWGTEYEGEAATAYAFHHDADLGVIGFVDHPAIAMSGASPDRLVGNAGLVEIKCPNTATHIETLIERAVPSKYVTQMQWQMACTEREWCDFVSYDPRLPEDMRLFVQRIERDGKFISELESEVARFLAELDDQIERLRASDWRSNPLIGG